MIASSAKEGMALLDNTDLTLFRKGVVYYVSIRDVVPRRRKGDLASLLPPPIYARFPGVSCPGRQQFLLPFPRSLHLSFNVKRALLPSRNILRCVFRSCPLRVQGIEVLVQLR
jgi:hypothetical protein